MSPFVGIQPTTNRRRRLPPLSASTRSQDDGNSNDEDDVPVRAVTAATATAALKLATSARLERFFDPEDGEMILCSCFAHISLNRNLLVQAWLDDRPWHIQEVERVRCQEDYSDCALVLVRSIFDNVLELESKLLKQLLTSLASTVFPEVCKRSWQSAKDDQEGFEKLLKLLRALMEPLESRAHIASVLARRLRHCLIALVEVADAGDEDLASELRSWLAELDSSDVLSRESLNAQRCLLKRMLTDTWEFKCRDRAVDGAYLM